MNLPYNHLFPPGPCEIAVGTGGLGAVVDVGTTQGDGLGGFAYEFLGTTREGGRAQEILYTGNISADYAGSFGMPADVCLSGKGLVIACQVHNFNPFTMKRLRSRYAGVVNNFSSPGFIDTNDMGALLINEARYVPICIRSLNAYSTAGEFEPSNARYPNNEAGLWVPVAFPGGEMGWDYAAREQIFQLMFMGLTYMNYTPDGDDPQFLNTEYNQGVLYSVNNSDIKRIWDSVTNPSE